MKQRSGQGQTQVVVKVGGFDRGQVEAVINCLPPHHYAVYHQPFPPTIHPFSGVSCSLHCMVFAIRTLGHVERASLQKLVAFRPRFATVVALEGCTVPRAIEVMKLGAFTVLADPCLPQELKQAVDSAVANTVHDSHVVTQQHDIEAGYRLLTRRERDVFHLVVAGHTNKAIASQLGVSRKTVEVHRSRVMRKMGASSVPDLVRAAMVLPLIGESRMA